MLNAHTYLLKAFIALSLFVSLNACEKKLPDPVVRKDGYAYIPIANTAFLIPEKTWLKSYGRKSTDGMVDSFYLHVTAPDVKPWSEGVNAQMYPPRGPGQRADVYINDMGENFDNLSKRFYQAPQSRWGSSHSLTEVESDLAADGLRKFREPVSINTVFYERIENDRVKYFIYCDDDAKLDTYRQFCHLSFPLGNGLFVDDLSFTRNYLPNSIRMADQIAAKLKEFEIAARTHQKQPASY